MAKDTAIKAAIDLGKSALGIFTGKFEKALPYFLSIEDSRPELSRKWTENTIDMFSLEGK